MVQVEHLTKTFNNVAAVKDLQFSAQPGEIFGLLGPNGAGKTTTIRVIATLLTPTSGNVVVNGHDVIKEAEKVRAAVGILTADFGLYDRLTGRENIRYAGHLYGLSGTALEKRITELAGSLEMERFIDRRAGKYSTGMKQKAALARSIVHDPSVVIFDEPTAGLDVIAAQTVIAMMKRFRVEGKLVILSTHDMHAAEQLCDRVAIMHRAALEAIGTVAEIEKRTNTKTLEAAFLAQIGQEEAIATLKANEEAAVLKPKKRSLWRR